MSGINEPPEGAATPSSPPDQPADDAAGWPAQDFATEGPWDVKTLGNRRRPTRAEQAVPWLIGLVLALSGMLIVVLSLVFSSTDGLLPAYGTPSPDPTPATTPRPQPTPAPEPSLQASPSLEPTPTPVPEPTYPPFEIVFMQRPTANSPAYLYTHDFATSATPFPLARDSRGVSWYSWAPDGGRGLAILDGSPHLLIPGRSSRDLGDGFDSIAYAADSVTAYGIRSTLAGSNDRTELLEVDLTTEAVTSLTTWTYPHPITYRESPPVEAQFADDGGFERVYVLEDGRVVVWVLGAPATYTFDPGTGATGTLDATPTLWSPDGLLRAFLAESGSRSRIAILGLAGEERASLNVTGLVSHIRWSANSNQIAFTVTTTSSGGAVYQDLWAWDLDSDSAAARLTQDQRSLGAGYRGAREIWKP